MDVADGLGQDNLDHGLALAEAQGPGRLALPLVHSLDAGTDDLGDVGGGIDTQRDGHPHELAQLQEGEDIRQHKIEDIQLQQDRRAADDFHIDGGNKAQNLQLGHFQHGDQGAEHGAQSHGDKGQNQGVLQAGEQEELPILAPNLCHIWQKQTKIHVFYPFKF